MLRYTQARTHRGVNGSPVCGCVGVFSCEEERVFNRLGELLRSVETAGGDITVRPQRERITAPVVGVTLEKKIADPGGFDRKDTREGGAGMTRQFGWRKRGQCL